MKFLELLSMNDELSGQPHFMLEQVAKAPGHFDGNLRRVVDTHRR